MQYLEETMANDYVHYNYYYFIDGTDDRDVHEYFLDTRRTYMKQSYTRPTNRQVWIYGVPTRISERDHVTRIDLDVNLREILPQWEFELLLRRRALSRLPAVNIHVWRELRKKTS